MIYQAIESYMLPAFHTQPMRIKATCKRGFITVTTCNPSSDEHCRAVFALLQKFKDEDNRKAGTELTDSIWNRPLVHGVTQLGTYIHVFLN